ncbi:helix-turn-helix transcriptional regulator [Archaeoglobus neptunius]|uniref:helix-turn-helix transcriptional regulator n=1 Tax=Archaeoglobus neptunius TaxID=2798580 RepID=UPI001925BF37|nr:transcriptional regulator FilR1 domain-containing protein [Archaeoglobus neptunius]
MIREILSCRRRMNILYTLTSSPATFSELKRKTGINHTSLSIHLKKLQRSGLICREGRKYKLSMIGKVAYSLLDAIDRTTTTFERNLEFWIEHDFSSIPLHLMIRISDLGHYNVVSLNQDFFHYLENEISNAKWAKVVSCIALPFSMIDTDLEVVFGKEAGCGKIVADGIHIICVTTDQRITLALPFISGGIDLKKVIVSRDKQAVKWGKDIYEYFYTKAMKLCLKPNLRTYPKNCLSKLSSK